MYIMLLAVSLIISSLLFAFFNNIYLTIKAIHFEEKPKLIKSLAYQVLNVIIIFAFLLMVTIFLEYKEDLLNTLFSLL